MLFIGLVDFIASAMGVDVLEGSDAAPLVFLELARSLVFQKGSPRLCGRVPLHTWGDV